MKSIILVALAVVAVAVAAPPAPSEVAQILRSVFDQKPEGGYSFGFETDNGIKRDETGEVKEALDEDNKPHPVVVVRGSYSYFKGDGTLETVNYVADETGFHAEGDSIPKPVSRR